MVMPSAIGSENGTPSSTTSPTLAMAYGMTIQQRIQIRHHYKRRLDHAIGTIKLLETAHAYAAAKKWCNENPGKRILIGNSGRGDKDMPTLTQYPARTRSYAAA